MLDKLNMSKDVSKKELNKVMESLGGRLGVLQRKARDLRKPIIIVFEGWRGTRRENIINTMMQYMDARGFRVLSSAMIGGRYGGQPIFTYFWENLPAKGQMDVFYRSWYYTKMVEDCIEKRTRVSFDSINSFEKVLTDDGYIILKYFLHISKDQQRKTLEKKEKNLGKNWDMVELALDDSKNYEEYYRYYQNMLASTDTANAPWHLISAEDYQNAQLEIYSSIADNLEAFLTEKVETEARDAVWGLKYDALSSVNPQKELTKEDYKEKLEKYQKKLSVLQLEIFSRKIPVIIGFEGWDAAGKGGAIRRLTAALNPLCYLVRPIAAPNVVEKDYNYQWRFWVNMPAPGNITIFDRTWYGRVMVERLEGFARAAEWQRAYDEIKEMEKQWTDAGVALAKFWLQIDKEEQLRRFEERQNNPIKEWKITAEDWRNREKWTAYEGAVNEMLVRTSTDYAPWTIVEGNNKYYARLKVLKTIIDLFEEKLGK